MHYLDHELGGESREPPSPAEGRRHRGVVDAAGDSSEDAVRPADHEVEEAAGIPQAPVEVDR